MMFLFVHMNQSLTRALCEFIVISVTMTLNEDQLTARTACSVAKSRTNYLFQPGSSVR